MTAAEADREQRLAEGKVDAAKLPRLLTGVVVTAVIAASVWVLSGATLPFQPAPLVLGKPESSPLVYHSVTRNGFPDCAGPLSRVPE